MTFPLLPYRASCLLLASLCATWSALADGDTPADDAPPAGARMALQGAGDGVGACAACHGVLGEGMAAAGFPRLAGQPAFYLGRQLRGYADGRRQHEVMGPIARRLSPEQIRALAAYYSALQAPPAATAPSSAASALLARGQTLAHLGDHALRVQACVNCHGPGGTGEPPRVPYLSGQSASYIEASLVQWSSGNRDTDPSGQMPEIAQRLSARDRRAVAAYFASQPPPAPAAERLRALPPGTAGSAVEPGEASGVEPQSTKGVGVEQGAPTTGGNAGPGGATYNQKEGREGREGQ